jgi:8-oxo-dGTP pyrophosphatase MutT (NUDIX family)
MTERARIRVKAMAFLPNAARTHHAVLRGSDPSDGETFHRLLGGGVEPGERSVEAVVREISEELRATLLEPRLLGVLESLFVYDGEPGHEIVFVYAGHLAEGDVVPPEGGLYDDVGIPMWVEWRPCDERDPDALLLYPDGVGALLPLG